MPEPSLIESYLAAMRGLLNVSRDEADRILEEAEDHLSQGVLQGVESGLSLREAEERAIAQFGLPREICGRFRQVYRPWHRRSLDAVRAAAIGGLVLGAFPLAARMVGADVPILASAIPIGLGFLPAFCRRSLSAGLAPGLAAGVVSMLLLAWCAFGVPGWYREPAQRPPIDALGIEFATDLLMVAAVLLQVAAGAALGARLRRRDVRLA